MIFSLLAFNNPAERTIYRWFEQALKSPHAQKATATKHLQQHLPTVILMLEWRFKGYKHLKKGYRSKCHKGLKALQADFELFTETKKIITPSDYLEVIRQYLQPGRFEYRESASFDTLMADPTKKVLVGDCNQLVSLYIWFYSLRFPITDLHLKLMLGHVCLHHNGTDYETTSGQITEYPQFTRLAHVNEIIAVTVLDVSDPKSKQFSRSPETQYLAAKICNIFSEERRITQHNLQATHKNYVLDLVNQKKFAKALQLAGGKTDLSNYVLHHQALDFLEKKKYQKSRQNFKKLHNPKGEKMVDQHELQDLLTKIKSCKTLEDYKSHLSQLRKIKKLAHRLHNDQIEDFCKKILKEL